MEKQLKYNEPWILQRADPYVYCHTDGTYYFTASVPEYDRIVLRRAAHLADLADAEELRTGLAALGDEVGAADDVDDVEAALDERVQIGVADVAAADERNLYRLDGRHDKTPPY